VDFNRKEMIDFIVFNWTLFDEEEFIKKMVAERGEHAPRPWKECT